MNALRQEVENPMVHPIPYRAPVTTKCACGCGEVIVEGYEYIEWEDLKFNETACFMKYHGAEWR